MAYETSAPITKTEFGSDWTQTLYTYSSGLIKAGKVWYFAIIPVSEGYYTTQNSDTGEFFQWDDVFNNRLDFLRGQVAGFEQVSGVVVIDYGVLLDDGSLLYSSISEIVTSQASTVAGIMNATVKTVTGSDDPANLEAQRRAISNEALDAMNTFFGLT